MEMLTAIVELVIAFFKFLFAVPILGVLVLVGTFGPRIIKAAKHR